MEDYLHTGKSHTIFFYNLYLKVARENGDHLPIVNRQTGALIKIIISVYNDYKLVVNTLIKSIDPLVQEVVTLQAATPYTNKPTLIPFPLTDTRAPGTTASPSTQTPSKPHAAGPKVS